MILADKIISLRKKAGWSQEELAQQLDVSPAVRLQMGGRAVRPRYGQDLAAEPAVRRDDGLICSRTKSRNSGPAGGERRARRCAA